MTETDTSASRWQALFCDWPAEIAQRGVLVTSFGEQIPFAGFLTGKSLLLLERQTPDVAGARMIVLGYESISALKITEVVKPRALRSLGFEGSLPKDF